MDETELRNSLTTFHSASFAWATACCRGDRELAEEVLQSVYVKLLSGRAKFAGRSSFRTWLFAVIRNVARDHRRGRWWSRVIRLDWESLVRVADDSGVVPDVENDELLLAIRTALKSLPERQRQIAHLVFYEEMSITEAANVMKVAVGTARQHYARAKATLKKQLQHLAQVDKGYRAT